MAKKAKTESVLAKETRRQAEADALAAGRRAAQKAEEERAERAAEAAREAEEAARGAAEAARERDAARAAKAARPKKARFVREAKEKKPPAKPAAATPRSTSAGGKMMSRNLKAAPKEGRPPVPRNPKGRR